MNKKELIKLLDKYEIEYEITDNTKEVEEGLRLLDEALEKIGIVAPKETQVDNITRESDPELPKYTTEWASSSDLVFRQATVPPVTHSKRTETHEYDCISRQAVEEMIKAEMPERGMWEIEGDKEKETVCEVCVDLMQELSELPPIEPPKKVIAQVNIDTDEIVKRIKEEYEIKDLPVCEDAISRADTLKALCAECDLNCLDGTNKEAYCTEYAAVKGMPTVEPKRPKTTETMIVDGEPMEIDPLSYEVGYSHGQSERPKGEWVKATGVAPPEFAGRYVCSNCGHYALMDMPYGSRQELSPFCPNCGADMRGDEE